MKIKFLSLILQVIAMELEEVENQFQVPSEPHQEPLLDDREMLRKIQLKESQVLNSL